MRALRGAAAAAGIAGDVARLFPDLPLAERDRAVPLDDCLAFAAALLRDPATQPGLAIGARMPLAGFGPWGLWLRSSDSVGEMLARASRTATVFCPSLAFRLERLPGEALMVEARTGDLPALPSHEGASLCLAHCLGWSRHLALDPPPVREARFRASAPREREVRDAFYGCRVVFGADTDAFVLDADAAARPLRDAAPELAPELERTVRERVRAIVGEEDIRERVRASIEASLPDVRLGEREVARGLAMTVRTLHRRLGRRDSSFREIREEVLRRKAEHLLHRADISLAAVALELGYSEPSTFHRAFKRWTGVTPGSWRAAHGRASTSPPWGPSVGAAAAHSQPRSRRTLS